MARSDPGSGQASVTGTRGAETPDEIPEAIPAATVVLVRDVTGPPGIEVLLLRRNANLTFAGGMWVFPGGRVDEGDREVAAKLLAAVGENDDVLAPGLTGLDHEELTARVAAIREANEEAGVVLSPADLAWFSHWTPPPVSLKRFATWFFVAPARDDIGEIVIDGGEIHEHGWFRPADALRRCDAGELGLSPPTWISLEYLALFPTVAGLIADARARTPEFFATRIAMDGGDVIALYDGDAGYVTSDPTLTGGRHRLVMAASGGWRYERDDWPPALHS